MARAAFPAKVLLALVGVLFALWGCMNGTVLNALKAAEAGPAAPRSMTIVIGSSQATISWPAVQGANSYNLYWAAGPTVSISSGSKISGAVSPQVVTGLNNGTQYAFLVTSVNNYRESSTGSMAAITPGAAPVSPTISSRAAGERQVTVNWPTVAGAASYNLYWKQGSTVDTSTGTKIAGATSPQVINDPSMTDGTQYSFIVTSVDSFGESAASAAVNATTNLYVLYGSNYGGNGVVALKMNSSTGVLTPVSGSPFAAGNNTNPLSVDPSGHFLYVPNSLDGSVTAFAINQASGALVQVSGSPYPVGTTPIGTAIDPTGKFLYVANYTSHTISIFSITPGSGALASLGSSGSGSAANAISIDPSGKYLYVPTNYITAGYLLYVFTLDATTGAVGSQVTGSPFYVSGGGPNFAAVDPTDSFVYVAGYYSTNLDAYKITAGTGVLTAVSGSPFTTGSGYDAGAVDPSGKYLYVTNYGNNSVSAYKIQASTGALTAISGSPYAAGANPWGIVIDPTGKFVYAANFGASNGGISGYAITAGSGALTALTGSPFATTNAYIGLTIATIVTP